MDGLFHRETGTGAAVVLLHPVGLDGSFWGALPTTLGAMCRVIALDLPGHGRSAPAARPGRMDAVVSQVAAHLEGLRAGPSILVGVSFGGMIAQHLALSRPDLVRGLVIAGSPGTIPAVARPAILARGAEAERGGMAAVVDATLERWLTPGNLSTEAVSAVRLRLLSDDPSGFAAAWEAISGHDALADLPRLAVPACVIAGTRDAATSLDAKRALAAAIPGARLVVLEGAPHMMQIEREAEFVAVVAEFVAQVLGAAR